MSVLNLGDMFEGRIGVDHDGIGRISMSGGNLLSVRRPVERGDLRQCFQSVQACLVVLFQTLKVVSLVPLPETSRNSCPGHKVNP